MYKNETAAWRWQDASGGGSWARTYLRQFLQDNATSLQAILCGYVARMGLATGENIKVVAAEVFQDAVLEALAHAENFNPEMQPRAWFLAVAANILKRHRAAYARRYRFEVLIGDLANKTELENEHDLLDRLMAYTGGTPGPEQSLVTHESVHELLALVSQEDAHLLNLALIQGWDSQSLGAVLGVTPGAARVRAHRALSRLRDAWYKAEQRKEQRKRHG